MPVTRELSYGQRYFLPDVLFPNKPKESVWMGDEADRSFLEAGLVHLTPRAAIQYAMALRSSQAALVCHQQTLGTTTPL